MKTSDLRGISVRTQHALSRVGIHTVESLTTKTEDELMSIHDFGIKSLGEVETALSELGLALKSCHKNEKTHDDTVSNVKPQENGITCYEVYYDLYVHVTGSVFVNKKPLTLEEIDQMIFSDEGIRKVKDITTNPTNSYEGHMTIFERRFE